MGVRWRRCLWCFVFFLLGRHVPCGAVLVCSALLLLHNRNFCSEKTRTSHGIHLNATLVLVVNFKKYCEALVSARICAKFGVSASGSGGQNICTFHCSPARVRRAVRENGERAVRINFALALRVAGSLYFRPFVSSAFLIGRGGFGASGPRH
jgi:hypothetical protein